MAIFSLEWKYVIVFSSDPKSDSKAMQSLLHTAHVTEQVLYPQAKELRLVDPLSALMQHSFSHSNAICTKYTQMILKPGSFK